MLFAYIAFLVCSGAAVYAQECCDAHDYCPNTPPCPNGTTCCMERPGGWSPGGSSCINGTMTCSMCPVYNPNHPEQAACPLASPVCCVNYPASLNTCFPSTMQCCHHFGSYDSHPCPKTTTCCGITNGNPSCCDPSTQACVNDVCTNGLQDGPRVPDPTRREGGRAAGSR